jgi:hypothetical protein
VRKMILELLRLSKLSFNNRNFNHFNTVGKNPYRSRANNYRKDTNFNKFLIHLVLQCLSNDGCALWHQFAGDVPHPIFDEHCRVQFRTKWNSEDGKFVPLINQ